ncbi:hypothetical protein M3703_02135 [Mannheimia haemolytica]|uniref:hypothetical protein n=1 Tax=Mannheimia haemolytica TaxID=75985 RepID=UPI00201C9AB7|nr:hypothetical protein [Mannheimia haemolytica]UQX80151.1 hypothetical protein M3703_02135 [Mannheimia haemolytica]
MNKQIKEMLDQIENLPQSFSHIERVIYSAMELLADRTNILDIDLFDDWILDINTFYPAEKEEEYRLKAKEFVNREPEKVELFFDDVFETEPFDYSCFKHDEFCDYFNLPNYYSYDSFEILELYLKEYGIDYLKDDNIKDYKKYEIFALLALNYINRILRLNNKEVQLEHFHKIQSFSDYDDLNNFLEMSKEKIFREVTGAFISLDIAKELKQKEVNAEMEDTIIKKFLAQMREKGEISDTSKPEK